MSEEGEKGFVIKDRRSFDERGERKQEEEGKEQPENAPEKKAPEKESQRPPLPEVNFSSLILSLSSTAFLHLGEIPDPATGQRKKDMLLAKHVIDTIGMLKEKTEGNLNAEEKQLIANILTDLRLRYVKNKEG
ncbi:MAG: DUF1844 domain-containing protein [Deltaproteobacteria bacterium]|nr:DUF1844 domain-containing protein [Deltaproteobacteria bacterium]OQX64852.1 MAG: hypothetical protein B5M55_05335 [Desulfococcus sp. 4484_242]